MIDLYHQKLFIVFNQARAKARKETHDPKLLQRLNKAFSILQSLDYYKEEKATYQPTYYSCNCEDWKYHLAQKRQYKGHCKHMISEILLERMKKLTFKQLDFFSKIGV